MSRRIVFQCKEEKGKEEKWMEWKKKQKEKKSWNLFTMKRNKNMNKKKKWSTTPQQTYFVGLNHIYHFFCAKHIYDIWVEWKCMDQHRATRLVQYEANLAQQWPTIKTKKSTCNQTSMVGSKFDPTTSQHKKNMKWWEVIRVLLPFDWPISDDSWD